MKKITRREFIEKTGKYALITGPALSVLLTSKRAMAQSTQSPYFHVWVGNNKDSTQPTGSLDPGDSSSNTTWTINSKVTFTYKGTQYSGVAYEEYYIQILGDTSSLRGSVDVTINQTPNSSDIYFCWDTENQTTLSPPQTSTITLTSSNNYKDTIGNGSITNNSISGNPRPIVGCANNCPGNGGTYGTVTFGASGVTPLTLTIKEPT